MSWDGAKRPDVNFLPILDVWSVADLKPPCKHGAPWAGMNPHPQIAWALPGELRSQAKAAGGCTSLVSGTWAYSQFVGCPSWALEGPHPHPSPPTSDL